MYRTSAPLRGLVLTLCLSTSCAIAGEWAGTMSCGELQDSPNAKSKDPFTGKVTLRVDGNRAVLERTWKTGAERSEGTVATGRPLQLVGTGSFTATPDKPWRVRATLTQRGDRYEGPGLLESPDGRKKFRDCSFELASTTTVAKAEAPATMPIQSVPPKAVATPEPPPSAPPEPPKAVEATVPPPVTAAVAPAPPPAPKEARREPANPSGSANTETRPASFGLAGLVVAFLFGAAAMGLGMTMVRRMGGSRAVPVATPPGPAVKATTETDRLSRFLETAQGLLGAVVLVAILVWGYNKFFGSPPESAPLSPTAANAPRTTAAVPGQANQVPSVPPPARPAPVPPAPPAAAQLTPEEQAVADRVKAHPTEEIVGSIRGQEMYPGVEIHYVPDQFGENPTCQVEFNGRQADGHPIQARKWFLVYVVSARGMGSLVSDNYFGTRNALRMYIDDSTQFIEIPVVASDDARLKLTPELSARLSGARKVKILHGRGASGEISFTYDFSNFAHVRNIAKALCGPK